MIARVRAEVSLRRALDEAPVTLLTGPRQVGKSSLARRVLEGLPSANFFDLEDPRDLARLAEPTLALTAVPGTIVIDEAQLRPDLFPVLRVLVDEDRRPGRFLVLGSASPDLVGLTSESLAGRITFEELAGFTLADVGRDMLDARWFRGGLPEAYLAPTDERANRWLEDYIVTFLQRDLAALGFGMPATTMRRFWTMLAHYHGQTWNGAEIARSIDVSETTVRRYVDALTDALVVRQLQPWYANLRKRQVKSARVYVRDTGLLHALLSITNPTELLRHPKAGASWEGMVVEHLAMCDDVRTPHFWSTHTGAEVDLLLETAGRLVGVEIKRTASPTTTKSMHSAIESLGLDHLYVVYSGEHRFPLGDQISTVPAAHVLTAATAAEAFAD